MWNRMITRHPTLKPSPQNAGCKASGPATRLGHNEDLMVIERSNTVTQRTRLQWESLTCVTRHFPTSTALTSGSSHFRWIAMVVRDGVDPSTSGFSDGRSQPMTAGLCDIVFPLLRPPDVRRRNE